MQCNYNPFIQIINFHGPFRNAPRCRKKWCLPNTGALTVLLNSWGHAGIFLFFLQISQNINGLS